MDTNSDVSPTRVSGCLSKKESLRLWFELGDLCVKLGAPFRIARQKWGRGWALYAVPIPASEYTDSTMREALHTLAEHINEHDHGHSVI